LKKSKYFSKKPKKAEKSEETEDSEGKIWILIDFSAPACRWQPSGRNDIENPNTQYAIRSTHYE